MNEKLEFIFTQKIILIFVKKFKFSRNKSFYHIFLTVLIEFKSVLFTDQDFLFISIYSDAYTYLININMQFIHV